MARFKNQKKVFVKLVSMKKQANMDHITGDKIPRSFVFSRCKLPGPLKQLQADLRKLMLPYTALKLKMLSCSSRRRTTTMASIPLPLLLLRGPNLPGMCPVNGMAMEQTSQGKGAQ